MYCNKATTTCAVENIFSYGMEDKQLCEDIPTYNYEDEDAFSDVDYDSDDCEANLNKGRCDDSEDEIWEEDDNEKEDEEISNTLRLKLLREENKKQLEGLSALAGKLNWLEKVHPVGESDVDNDDYPVLGAIIKPTPKAPKRKTNRSPHHTPNKPASYIEVRVGNRNFIEVRDVICKSLLEGKTCSRGEKCRFSHDLPKPKIDHSTRLCNFIRNNEQCKFEGRCRFSHDLSKFKTDHSTRLCHYIRNNEQCKFEGRCRYSHDLSKRSPPSTDNKPPKPMCRNGLKCENRKCTFTHPPGHKKAPKQLTHKPPTVRTPHSSPAARTPHSSPAARTPHSSPAARAPHSSPDKKFLLCKNLFNVNGGIIETIGPCRFANNCMFAHSRMEVEKRIKDNLFEFECKHKDCKGVEVEFITKKDKEGKERKTRRYKNSASRKCFKIHQNERITDFIVRTQGPRA